MSESTSQRTFAFFRLQTRTEALAHLQRFERLEAETASLKEAVFRVAAEDVVAPEDLPAFVRSTVDGFAVRARETFGASEGSPAYFELAGEAVMGRPAEQELLPGQTIKVWTGGMLPPGADAVVMLEYCRPVDEHSLELTKAVPPGGNTIAVGEDVAKGEVVIRAGDDIRAQEAGLLAGLGVTEVAVVRRPRVAVISTGNELVEYDQTPPPGAIREINSHTLCALLASWGAEPSYLGLIPDDPRRLEELVAEGLEAADAVLVSGGSSVGAADWTLEVFQSFPDSELLVHGVAISPGKPLILVRVGQKSLWGLPGHVASAMITAHLFVRPLIRGRLLGASDRAEVTVPAVLTRNLSSGQGREDWVRVRLKRGENGLEATPVLGPSGLISTLTRADGLIKIDLEAEGLLAGSVVEVHLI